ncbi:MAG: hypothetical protein IJX14_10355, partial [Clostridia bacterium]|nr:hypothetical protein [Clostridia bacterium]
FFCRNDDLQVCRVNINISVGAIHESPEHTILYSEFCNENIRFYHTNTMIATRLAGDHTYGVSG